MKRLLIIGLVMLAIMALVVGIHTRNPVALVTFLPFALAGITRPDSVTKAHYSPRMEQQPIVVYDHITGLGSGTAALYLVRFPVKVRVLKAEIRFGTVANSKTCGISKATINSYAQFPEMGAVLNTDLPQTTSAYTAVASSQILVTASTSTSSGLLTNFLKGANFSLTADDAGEPVIETNECLVVTCPADATFNTAELMITALPE